MERNDQLNFKGTYKNKKIKNFETLKLTKMFNI